MVLSIYFLSLLFFVLGWIYYYKPGRIQKIHNFFKEKVFNDRYILLQRKKIAVVFFIAACILFTSAFIISQDQKNQTALPSSSINKEIIFDVISVYTKLLSEQPDNIIILTKLAYSYEALGEQKRGMLTWKKIMDLDPENETTKQRLAPKQ